MSHNQMVIEICSDNGLVKGDILTRNHILLHVLSTIISRCSSLIFRTRHYLKSVSVDVEHLGVAVLVWDHSGILIL